MNFLTDPQAAAIAPSLTVPLEAVSGNGTTGTVFLVEGGTVEARQVGLGLRTAQTVMVLLGLSARDRIASGDLLQLHDGAKVQVLE